MCLCRGNDITGPCEPWNIRTFDKPHEERRIKSENVAKNKFSVGVSVLLKTLEKSGMKFLQNHLTIVNIKLYDSNESVNTESLQSVLNWCKEYDVVHMVTRSMSPETRGPVVSSLHSLQDQCVLVSPCISTKRPPAPVDFPCQMSIAVGLEQPRDENKQEENVPLKGTKEETKGKDIELRPLIPPIKNRVKWQSCGSALDFVCHRQYGDIEINNPWEASYFVTAITALILVKAYVLGEY